MPATGNHAAVDRGFSRRAVDVEGLRIERAGEGDDFFLAHGARAEVDLLADEEVLEVKVLALFLHAASWKPGAAMKRARW
jgi:hypothetical protein